MPLLAGTTLGSYEILAPLGAGGMGEVYRAKDTKLDRQVAIKILPDALAQDPDRLARFDREAKVLASLNHPNIAQIYGIEGNALVMELVQGDTLKCPAPLEYAKQIAEALEAAHEKGVTHRDLKPANIMVTPEGVVKVLDFGLAFVATEKSGDPMNSPTLTMRATDAGMIMGTAAYMSPEQASGKPVDKRADIWSFGVVLWEMLTGSRLFHGETVSHTLADVLRGPIEFDKLPKETPSRIRELLKRCLDRDAKMRLRDIGEARVVIGRVLAAPGGTEVPLQAEARATWVPWIVAGVSILALVGFLLYNATRPAALRPLIRLSVDLGPEAVAGRFTTTAISPDGLRVAFAAKGADGKQALATRLLSETKPVVLPGTADARDPFFSPDGEWVGFFADAKMKKISVRGGAPVVLCDASDARGADWGEDGKIVAALNLRSEISLVPADGGAPRPVTKLTETAVSHLWPQALPEGGGVLFTMSHSQVSFEDASIAVASFKTGEVKTLVRGGYFGRYVPTGDSTGHLVYIHEGVLFAVPFRPGRAELRGAAVPLLDDIASDPSSGAGQFSFSQTPPGPGTFAYRSGKVPAPSWPVSWLDGSGKIQPLIANAGLYVIPRFSPDGRRLAMVQVGTNGGILVYDLRRDTISRLTFDTEADRSTYPTWSPDGKHLVFRFLSPGNAGVRWIRADGAGETQNLLDGNGNATPYCFFPDGKRLAYSGHDLDSGWDIWTLPLDVTDPDHPKPGKPEVFLHTAANELRPAVAPNGRWIAYQSDESGLDQVYVRPFPVSPGGSAKWQISSAGGTRPVWSRTGRMLFFENLDNQIMATDYENKNESFVAGKPRLWSDQRLQDAGGYLNYDAAPDGRRFAVLPDAGSRGEGQRNVRVTFLLNFFDELRRRAREGK